MEKIGIRATRHSAFYAPLLVAITDEFLRPVGLEADYTIVDADKTVIAGIADGSVQVAQSAIAISWLLLESAQQPNYQHFAQINQRDGFFIVARNSTEPFKWTDFIGKTIIADYFFQPLAMLRYVLHNLAIAEDKIKLIDAGGVDEIEAAYRDGQGDFVQLQGPAAQQLEHDGLGKVVAAIGDEIGSVAFSSLCASPEWLDTDKAKAFTKTYISARKFVQTSTANEIAQLIKPQLSNIDFDVLCSTVTAYKKLDCWSGDIQISKESYDTALDVFEYNNLVTQRYPYDAIISQPPSV